MIGIRVHSRPPDHLAHYRADDGSELRVVCGQFLHRSRETGGAWIAVPMLALADVFEQARADEHTATTPSEARATIEAMGQALVEFR